MHERYIAFDVETPNYQNNRMSAIGITVVENGVIAEEKYYLINPEVRFDSFNIALTGITPESVENERTFSELWDELSDYLDSGILIAHNAPFDMRVLSACLNGYGISWKHYAEYACTCTMGRRFLPDLPNHKLNTMCDYLGFDLDHHNAGSDSTACANLLLHYIKMGEDVTRYIRKYDLRHACTLR